MNFRDTINNLIVFYKKFDETFNRIDDYFEQIDDKGGKDGGTIRRIITELSQYHKHCYCKQCVSSEQDYDDDIKKIMNDVNSLSDNIEEYADVVKRLQLIVRNRLLNDFKWSGQQACIELIETILDKFSDDLKQTVEQEDTYFATIRILRELVGDCSIAIKCLCPLLQWDYGSVSYSKLSAEEQLTVLLNQAILIDRMYFGLRTLEVTLKRLNKIINSFEELDWSVYYVAGFLNFKIHQYKCAREYFGKVIIHSELKESLDIFTSKRYFHSMLLIAYSYEYNGEFGNAIKAIAICPQKIAKILDSYLLEDIDNKFDDIMDKICKQVSKDTPSLFGQYMELYSKSYVREKNVAREYEILRDMQFEILHAFGHCLNEYAIKKVVDENNKVNYGKTIRLARCVMKNIAMYKPEYWTCYATIHGEYQDYHQALEELDKAQEKLSRDVQKSKKETLMAEISFFKYYFNLLCNRVSEEDKKRFESYYKKYDDDDAKCHLKIFEFRNELRKYLSMLFDNVNQLAEEVPYTEENLLNVSNELRTMYEELCSLNPTLYMNVNVRAELRLMQRAYDCLVRLRTFLITPTHTKLLGLRNACNRFSNVKEEFSLLSNKLRAIDKNVLPQVVSNTFSIGKTSILNSLFSADSIFILAPISGVIVFQYQTGTIGELFSSTSVLPAEKDEWCENLEDMVNDLFEPYNHLSVQYGQPKLTNINWNELSKYTSEIFYWNNEIPAQVVVARADNSSFVRQIEDVGTFTKTIQEIRNCFLSQSHRKACTDIKKYKTQRCTFQKVELPWLEIINESSDKREFCIIWDANGEGTCFLSAPKNCDKHIYHSWIRQICIEYETNQETDEVVCLKDKKAQIMKCVEEIKIILVSVKYDKEYMRKSLKDKREKYSRTSKNENVIEIERILTETDRCLCKINEIEEYISQKISLLQYDMVRDYLVYLKSIQKEGDE